ncbi:MAG TPA: carboxypeptidase-like regulatory domain-containing protein [Candidatus Angelobacter sp.]|nr:carboxypeptidase-like regulatory domain-containing protein [Candidatus Angelobacter sp.]
MRNFPALHRKHPEQTGALLSNIRIASPCPADWNTMVGDDRVRHCSECNLNVYNLSMMTEQEAVQLISERQGQRLCLRLYRRSDGTVLTNDCPWSLQALKRRTLRIAGAVLSVILSTGIATAKTLQQRQLINMEDKNHSGLMVTATDQQGAVIVNARIELRKGRKSGAPQANGLTGNDGIAQLQLLGEGDYILRVWAQGFLTTTRKIKLETGKMLRINVPLKVSQDAIMGIFVDTEPPLIQKDAQVTNTFDGQLLR